MTTLPNIIREHLEPLSHSDQIPAPEAFLTLLHERGIPESEWKPILLNEIHLGVYTRRERVYLKAILAGLSGQ